MEACIDKETIKKVADICGIDVQVIVSENIKDMAFLRVERSMNNYSSYNGTWYVNGQYTNFTGGNHTSILIKKLCMHPMFSRMVSKDIGMFMYIEAKLTELGLEISDRNICIWAALHELGHAHDLEKNYNNIETKHMEDYKKQNKWLRNTMNRMRRKMMKLKHMPKDSHESIMSGFDDQYYSYRSYAELIDQERYANNYAYSNIVNVLNKLATA